MRPLEWTGPALDDLRSIDQWLTDQGVPEIAARMLRAIRQRADFLLTYPQGGPMVTGRDFRALRVMATPYVLLYRIRRDRIQILRVRHVREDWRPE